MDPPCGVQGGFGDLLKALESGDDDTFTLGSPHDSLSSSSSMKEELFSTLMHDGNRTEQAALAAVTDVLEGNGITLSPTGYFTGLMFTIAGEVERGTSALLPALLRLLVLVLPRLECSVAVKKSLDSVGLLCSILERYGEDEGVIQACLGATGMMLGLVWSSGRVRPEEVRLWQMVMGLGLDAREGVRSSSVQSVEEALLHAVPGTLGLVGKVARAFVEDCVVCGTQRDAKTSTLGVRVLHAVLPRIDGGAATRIASRLLQLCSPGSPQLSVAVLRAIAHTFAQGPLEPPAVLPLLQQAAELQPPHSDEDALVAYIGALEAGLVATSHHHDGGGGDGDGDGGVRALPLVASRALPLVLSPSPVVRQSATNALRTTATRLGPLVGRGGCGDSSEALEVLKQGLALRYQSAWRSLLTDVYSPLLSCAPRGLVAANAVAPLLVRLAGLREAPDFVSTEQLGVALGAGVRGLGVQAFLSVLPLGIGPSGSEPRPWLLPILRDHIRHASLGYFADHLLPLVTHLQERKASAPSREHQDELDIVTLQVWMLLPGFCLVPIDASKAFPALAPHLAAVLQDAHAPDEAQLSVLKALALLALTLRARAHPAEDPDALMQQLHERYGPSLGTVVGPRGLQDVLATSHVPQDQAQRDCKALSALSKQFLPILFNLYGCEGTPVIQAHALVAVRAWLAISEARVVNRMFKSTCKKVLSEQGSSPEGVRRLALLLELVAAFVPHLDADNADFVFRAVKGYLVGGTPGPVQKRAYRVVQHLCAAHPSFAATNGTSVLSLLVSNMGGCRAAAKRGRLYAVAGLARALKPLHQGGGEATRALVAQAVPEVVLCLKEASSKARGAAQAALVSLGEAMLDDVGQDPGALAFHPSRLEPHELDRYARQGLVVDEGMRPHLTLTPMVQLCAAGLAAASPMMLSATISALALLVGAYRACLEAAVASQLVGMCLLPLQLGNREIAKAVFQMLKVAAGLPAAVLRPHLGALVPGMLTWQGDGANKFVAQARIILERLLRKFPAEELEAVVPQDHKRLLAAVRKGLRRKAARGASTTKSSDQSEAWALSGSADFLEPSTLASATRNGTTKRASRTEKAPSDDINIPVDPLGRFVVPPEEEEEEMNQDDGSSDGAASSSSTRRLPSGDRGGGTYSWGGRRKRKQTDGDARRPGQHEPYAYVQLDRGAIKRRRRQAVRTWGTHIAAAQKGATAGARARKHQRRSRTRGR